jgi:hypothetical protein
MQQSNVNQQLGNERLCETKKRTDEAYGEYAGKTARVGPDKNPKTTIFSPADGWL